MQKTFIIVVLFALFTQNVLAQTKVTGHVINERGESIEYVSIGIEEDDGEDQSSSVGVISDAQGHFTLTIPAGRKDELTFTHVSFQTATIPYTTYTDGHELTVTLKDKVIELAEVVVAIDKCEYEECLLSFNCYEVQDKQFVNVLNKPIYKRVTPAGNGKQLSVSPAESVVLKGKKKYCVTISVVDIKGKGRLAFPANFKSSYARHKVKGKMRKIPGCPMIVVKGYEVE